MYVPVIFGDECPTSFEMSVSLKPRSKRRDADVYLRSFDKRDAEKRRQRLIKQLASLGLKVTVEELPMAA